MAGTSNFTVRVADVNSLVNTRALSIIVAAANIAPVIGSVTATPQILLDNATSQLQVTASDANNGPSPLSYSWSIVSGGGLLSSTTLANPIYTPANVSVSTPVTLNVVVSDGAASVNQNIILTVNDAGLPLSVSTASLTGGVVGSAYTQSISASGGTAPYTWSLVSGSLPLGLSLNTASGVISGTPTAASASNFTLQVRDSINATASKALVITTINLVLTPTRYQYDEMGRLIGVQH